MNKILKIKMEYKRKQKKKKVNNNYLYKILITILNILLKNTHKINA